MIKGLPELFSGDLSPGIYVYTSRARPDTFAKALARKDWRSFHLDGQHIRDKRAFLNAAAQAMSFPAYFGHNWDALEECLNDLSWAPAVGHVLLYDDVARFATAEPQDWQIARKILTSTVLSRRVTRTPLFVFLRGAGRVVSELPRL